MKVYNIMSSRSTFRFSDVQIIDFIFIAISVKRKRECGRVFVAGLFPKKRTRSRTAAAV